jgi:hypothetical protein
LSLKTLALEGQEVLFVDDREANIEAAQRAGMTAIRFQSVDALSVELNRITFHVLLELRKTIALRAVQDYVASSIDEIRDRQGIRLLIQARTEFLPTTAQADQKSSMGAAWPETEASRASLVTSAAPSFSASTM